MNILASKYWQNNVIILTDLSLVYLAILDSSKIISIVDPVWLCISDGLGHKKKLWFFDKNGYFEV
jgi:hypothetical protein